MPTLIVQMGHSGRTTGATGAPGEMAFTESVGAACRTLLSRNGWVVRPIPADPPGSAYRGDAFVAVHADGNNNPAVRGASVGYQNQAGGDLAGGWKAAYTALGWSGPWNQDNYTTNLAQYYGVRAAIAQGNTRACIIECGTITNPTEHDAMTGPGGPQRVALAIGTALGIIDHPQEELMSYLDLTSPGLTIDNGQVLANRMDSFIGMGREVAGPGGGVNEFTARFEQMEADVDDIKRDLAVILARITALAGGFTLTPAGEITVTAAPAPPA